MEDAELEGFAEAAYRAAGLDSSCPTGPVALARGLGLDVCLGGVFAGCDAHLAREASGWTIRIRRGLAGARASFALHHEIAEWWLREHAPDEQREVTADRLAHRLRAPWPAYRAAVHALGLDLAALADAAVTSQTAAALRYLEVTRVPGAVVTPRAVRVRGEPWGWPDARMLRALGSRSRLPGGLDLVPIGDRRGAFLLLAS